MYRKKAGLQWDAQYYEHTKRDGSPPLVGFNTLLPNEHVGDIVYLD